jgi:hypothetical protein
MKQRRGCEAGLQQRLLSTQLRAEGVDLGAHQPAVPVLGKRLFRLLSGFELLASVIVAAELVQCGTAAFAPDAFFCSTLWMIS